MTALREHRKAQAADKLLTGGKWRGGEDGYMLATGWGDPIHSDSVGWLMTKTIRVYNAPNEGPPFPMLGCTTSGTSARRHFS
ncbi:hypothetical protein [Actinomadura rubrisoli]|uniref:Uncharacterized protein n=1 Tax=Actinomadura rubrisoli TaxID=2530368 RepID=A0A4R5ASX8_9ACTN|nr:hypothetical protein [Actinomadura rubrisoli]TDD75415.1 hypothetical protein E1298_31560 [Actinomadura rubrisoli]